MENDYLLLKESYSKMNLHLHDEEKDVQLQSQLQPKNAFQFQYQFQFPTRDKFDQMIAAVGSRAFQSLGPENLDCMIPLLDCINHKRGTGIGLSLTSDVTYSKHPTGDGSIIVKAKNDLPQGFIPGITYGAKGNAQLLCRYGFTLLGDTNVEPDGSSNDVVEIVVKGRTCELRAGPKSYTYGCLVKAMSLVVTASETETNERGGGIGVDGADADGACGMDDFLNDCEGEEEEFDGMYDEAANEEESEEDDEGEDEDEGDDGLGTEIQGLQSLVNVIQDAVKQYSLSGDSLKDAWSSPADSRERFSAILVTSEKRTLQLYVDAIHLILSKLKGERSDTNETKASSTASTGESKDGSNLLQMHAMELRDAYIVIRHPELS